MTDTGKLSSLKTLISLSFATTRNLSPTPDIRPFHVPATNLPPPTRLDHMILLCRYCRQAAHCLRSKPKVMGRYWDVIWKIHFNLLFLQLVISKNSTSKYLYRCSSSID